MKKIIVISTSLRTGSNSDMLADQFIEGAKAAGHEVEKIYPESHLAGTLFCGGVDAPRTIEGNKKLQEAYELGKSVKG